MPLKFYIYILCVCTHTYGLPWYDIQLSVFWLVIHWYVQWVAVHTVAQIVSARDKSWQLAQTTILTVIFTAWQYCFHFVCLCGCVTMANEMLNTPTVAYKPSRFWLCWQVCLCSCNSFVSTQTPNLRRCSHDTLQVWHQNEIQWWVWSQRLLALLLYGNS